MKKLLAILMCACFALSPLTVLALPASDGELTVNGVKLVENGLPTANTVTGAAYATSTNILALDGYSGGVIDAKNMGDDFTIYLSGTNTVTASAVDDCGVKANNALTIRGTGSLTIAGISGGAVSGINVTGQLSIHGSTLDISCYGNVSAYPIQTDNLLIAGGANVTTASHAASNPDTTVVQQASSIYCTGSLSVSGGSVVSAAAYAESGSQPYMPCGIFCAGGVSISQSSVTTEVVSEEGSLASTQCGLYSTGTLTVSRSDLTVSATGQSHHTTPTSFITPGIAYAITCMNAILIDSDVTISCEEAGMHARGLHSTNFEMSGGTLDIDCGNAQGSSSAIETSSLDISSGTVNVERGSAEAVYAILSSDLTVSGGSLTSVAGDASAYTDGTSIGIYCDNVFISGGSVDATGGAAGADGSGAGIHGTSITMHSGTLTSRSSQTGGSSQAITSAPDLVNPNDFTVHASINTSGDPEITYIRTDIANYKYVRFESGLEPDVSALLLSGYKGLDYRMAFTANGATPMTWSVAGDLPAGLSIDPATGIISGTPSAEGTSTFTVSVQNAHGDAAATSVSLSIFPAPAPTPPTPPAPVPPTPSGGDNPVTGDSFTAAPWILSALIAAGVLVILLRRRVYSE